MFASEDTLQGGASAGAFTLGPIPKSATCGSRQRPPVTRVAAKLQVPQSKPVGGCSLGGHTPTTHWPYLETSEPIESMQQGAISTSVVEDHRWRRAPIWTAGNFRGTETSSGWAWGIILHAAASDDIAHWYLRPPGDVRSSFALEVPANEYTCQGLELDLTCVCWDGDLIWRNGSAGWAHRRFAGNAWAFIQDGAVRGYLVNKYRVLMTRAREGMIIWVPKGDPSDPTRSPIQFDETAAYLESCGASPLRTSRQLSRLLV